MKRKNLISRIIDFEWAIAFRKRCGDDILNSNIQDFKLIRNPFLYWCADPFPIEEGDKTYVFFEAYHRFKRKGGIGYREITEKNAGRVRMIVNEPFHLSYPYVYHENGVWYMVPESKGIKKILRYRAVRFPDLWKFDRVLVDQIPAADTTLLPGGDGTDTTLFPGCDGSVKLFSYVGEGLTGEELQIIRLKDGSSEIICKIEDPDGRKRPAGKIFKTEHSYYRPSQLCTNTYGEALIFNKIVSVTENSCQEEELKRIGAGDIRLDRNVKISGIHTYNRSENWEVIDVEMTGFSIVRILALLPRACLFLKRFL